MLLIPSSPIGITLRNLSKPSSHDPRVIEGAAFKDSLSSWTICLLSIPVQRIFGTTCPPPTKHTISESKRVQSKGLLWQSQAIFWWSLTSHFMRVYTWNCGATISIRTFSWSGRVWPFIQELQSSKCGKACRNTSIVNGYHGQCSWMPTQLWSNCEDVCLCHSLFNEFCLNPVDRRCRIAI